jgi:hypothetical protein
MCRVPCAVCRVPCCPCHPWSSCVCVPGVCHCHWLKCSTEFTQLSDYYQQLSSMQCGGGLRGPSSSTSLICPFPDSTPMDLEALSPVLPQPKDCLQRHQVQAVPVEEPFPDHRAQDTCCQWWWRCRSSVYKGPCALAQPMLSTGRHWWTCTRPPTAQSGRRAPTGSSVTPVRIRGMESPAPWPRRDPTILSRT